MNRFLPVLALLLLAGPARAESLDSERVRDAIELEARRNLPDTVVDVAVHGLNVRGSVEVISGVEPSLRVRAEGDEDWVGKAVLDVEVSSSGRVVGTLRVTAEIAAYVEVPVLRQPVSRGSRIQAEDLGLARREADGLPSGVISDPSQLVGRVSKRDLDLNKLVREQDLEDRADAQRNQPVTLVVRTGSLQVTAAGILRADARVGDLVEVRSIATNQTVWGLLVSPDVVELPTARSSALSRR